VQFLSRLYPLLEKEGLDVLSQACVAQSGLGGVGGVAFQALVRMGIRRFKLAENGLFDPPDMNRQPGASASTMGRPKLDVYVDWARSINPAVELELYPQGISVDNIEEFLQGTSAYIGVIDAEKGQDVKAKSSEVARRMGIPLFTAGVIGFGAFMVNHRPDGMTPGAFWGSFTQEPGKLFPATVAEKFNPTIIERINLGAMQGTQVSSSIGANMAGTLLANEVITHILQPLGWLNRSPVFAPQYLLLDLASLVLKVESVDGR
jgi:molybdopterin/thiamine biosynthesis adenylyltransferase